MKKLNRKPVYVVTSNCVIGNGDTSYDAVQSYIKSAKEHIKALEQGNTEHVTIEKRE
jgi:hypothetical protein